MDLKNFFDLDKVDFTDSELELPYKESITNKEVGNMNKQEAIEKLQDKLYPDTNICYWDEGYNVATTQAIRTISKIDKLDKEVVPQFVVEWYEENKDDFEKNIFDLCVQFHNCNLVNPKLRVWFQNTRNKGIQTLVNMHQFGYEVEKEKLYTAKLKSSDEYLYHDKDYKEIRHTKVSDNLAHEIKGYRFTEDDLVKYYAWENNAYQVNEV